MPRGISRYDEMLLQQRIPLIGQQIVNYENINDPYFAQTSLLLHGDGANGSRIIRDSSPSPKTVTAFGNAQISTAQSKFGGASIAFDGNGDFVSAPVNDDFRFSGDFTIEFWMYANAFSNVNVWLDTRVGGASAAGIVIFTDSSGKVTAYSGSSFLITSSPVTLNQWWHIALSRESGTLRLFISGALAGSRAFTNNLTNGNFFSGRTNESAINFVNGYIDEIRITKGVARYTASFTPPTAPFLNF